MIGFIEQPRVGERWFDSSCNTGEEWIRTSDGRVYKAASGSQATIVIPPHKDPEPTEPVRELNRHERRAAASARHWKNRKAVR